MAENFLRLSLDILPYSLNPYESNEYSDSSICRLLYEPLIGNESELSRIRYNDNSEIIVKIKENYWGDGTRILSKDYLPLLKSVEFKYVKAISKDEILIHYLFKNLDHIKSILQRILFIPLHNDKIEYSGPYRVTAFERNMLILNKKESHPDSELFPFNKLIFLINESEKSAAYKFNNNEYDVSCISQFGLKEFDIKDNNFFRVKLPLIASFILSNDSPTTFDLCKIIGDINFGVTDEYIDYSNKSFSEDNKIIDGAFLSVVNPVNIMYSNYYPNKNIVSNLRNYLVKKGFNTKINEIPYHNSFQYNNINGETVFFKIISPPFKGPLGFYYFMAPYIKKKEKRIYFSHIVDLLNCENWNKATKNLCELKSFFDNNSRLIPIGSFSNKVYVRNYDTEDIASLFKIRNYGNLEILD